jgi:hypothetical protein
MRHSYARVDRRSCSLGWRGRPGGLPNFLSSRPCPNEGARGARTPQCWRCTSQRSCRANTSWSAPTGRGMSPSRTRPASAGSTRPAYGAEHGKFPSIGAAMRARILIYMAGRAAEKAMLRPLCGGADDDDYWIASMIGDLIGRDSAQRDAHEQRLRAKTRGLVRRHRRKIEALARALIEQPKMTDRQIRAAANIDRDRASIWPCARRAPPGSTRLLRRREAALRLPVGGGRRTRSTAGICG